ncbi:hypothetical protein [Solibacillus sp. FSL K6-1523]|uniref:hypothetical protein n=1 Tax=Solibacillus sp. FSL K6-1523 TaxID=2921471 RepID=UPI0030F6D0E4
MADQIAKEQLKNGEERWVLVHTGKFKPMMQRISHNKCLSITTEFLIGEVGEEEVLKKYSQI